VRDPLARGRHNPLYFTLRAMAQPGGSFASTEHAQLDSERTLGLRRRPASNSSSAYSEEWGVTLHNMPEQMAANKRRGAFIKYADLTELMLMMDVKLGGGVMDSVNEGQKLVRPA
jgi:hypothetical protein